MMYFDGFWLSDKKAEIINILQVKGRATIKELSYLTKQSKTTVRHQIKWLESISALKWYYTIMGDSRLIKIMVLPWES